MKDFFEPAVQTELTQRLRAMRHDNARQWGLMNAGQVLAHCSIGMQMVTGELRLRRALVGYLFGGFVKRLVTRDDGPLRRNTPTAPELVVTDEKDFETERAQLLARIEALAAAGPAACTSHPHAFFGSMTPQQWSVLTYKHLDHHLRQFGA